MPGPDEAGYAEGKAPAPDEAGHAEGKAIGGEVAYGILVGVLGLELLELLALCGVAPGGEGEQARHEEERAASP